MGGTETLSRSEGDLFGPVVGPSDQRIFHLKNGLIADDAA